MLGKTMRLLLVAVAMMAMFKRLVASACLLILLFSLLSGCASSRSSERGGSGHCSSCGK